MLEQIKSYLLKLNHEGFPIPLIRDPKTGMGSVSLTMLIISFNVVLVGLIGKWSKILGGVDLTQAMYLFGMSAGLYFSRTVVKNKDSIQIEKDN